MAQQRTDQRQQKHRIKTTRWLSAAGIIAVLLGGLYIVQSVRYHDRFLPNTEILGVDVSGKTVNAANTELVNKFGQRSYKFVDHGKTVLTVKGKDLGLSQDFKKDLKQQLSTQNPWSWTVAVFADRKDDSNVPAVNKAALQTFTTKTAADLNQNRTAPQNAKVVAQGDKFVVQKEKSGDQIDPKKLTSVLTQTLSGNGQTVALAETYRQPQITSNDKQLNTIKAAMNKLASVKANLTIENQTVKIPQETLRGMVVDQDGKASVSTAAVRAYVLQLSGQYGTIESTRQFHSQKRGVVSVPAGTYGWSINVAATTAMLVDAIKNGEDFTKEVSHNGSGYRSDGSDIGNTYVEVDKTNQHEYFIKDGKVVMESDVVTGKPDQPTPSGVFYVWKKERNATLKGKNSDGTDYASPVSYWMPIDYTGVGLHDSPWQPKYGGDWYKEHGSHGCVNNPPDFIAKLYAAVPEGTPVIVY